MKLHTKAAILITLVVFLLAAAGCTAPTVEKTEVDEVKAYADAIADNLFAAINEKDYGKFTRDFDQQMKDALTEEKFKEICGQLGECESKGIIGADKYQGYTRAYYKGGSTGFSRDMTFTIVFSASGDRKVSGFFYK